jgi:hypothetical protein
MIKFIYFNNTRVQVVANPYLFLLSLWDSKKDELGMYPRMFQIILTRSFPKIKIVYLDISVKNGHYLNFQLFNLVITTWSH